MGLSWSLTISLHGLGFATHGLSLTKSVISCFVKWTHAHNPCFSTLLHRRGLTIQNFCCMTWAHSPYFLFLHGWGPYTQYLYKIGLCVRNAQGSCHLGSRLGSLGYKSSESINTSTSSSFYRANNGNGLIGQ